jgi:hypothetical protein
VYGIRRAIPDDATALTAIAKAAKAHVGYPADWLVAWDAAPTSVVGHVSSGTFPAPVLGEAREPPVFEITIV